MAKLFIEDLEPAGKRVIMRVDFNVPIKNGEVDNDKRLRASLPSIHHVLSRGASLVLMSHLGRPNGEVNPKYSLGPVARALGSLVGRPVRFLDDCVGPGVASACGELKPGEVALLENLRFHIEEEGKRKNPDGTSSRADAAAVAAFRAALTRLGDLYVNDAFGTAHRAHSSMVGIDLPLRAAGYLLKKELDFLGDAVENPRRPFVAVIGGAKISGKIDVIESLLPRVDRLIIGGGMAYTFFKARGLQIGRSLLEEDRVDMARSLLEKAGEKLVLPADSVNTTTLDFESRSVGPLTTSAADAIGADETGVDIGAASISRFEEILSGAGTVVWNGPMGIFEIEQTAAGTFAIARALARITRKGAITIIGGGDSVSAVEKAGLEDGMSHISTGGGASLEFLEGKTLPGVAALSEKR